MTGPNVFLGYYKADQPKKIQFCEEQTYNTGDIVSIDEEGFMTIQGRSKRFAKVGGEMVSLTQIESYLIQKWPEYKHAVVTKPDESKGETLILFTEHEMDKKELRYYLKSVGLTEFQCPKTVQIVHKIPLLGSGKVDYMTLKQQI